MKKSIKNAKMIPISMKIKYINELEILSKLKAKYPQCFLLESISSHTPNSSQTRSRYSFIGFSPKLEIVAKNQSIQITNFSTQKVKKYSGDPKIYIRKILKKYASFYDPSLPNFTGGLVGYFGFEYIKYTEPKLFKIFKQIKEDRENFNDIDLMLFTKIVVVDNLKNKVILIQNIKNKNLKQNYQKAKNKLNKLAKLLLQKHKSKEAKFELLSDFKPLFTQKQYCSMIAKAKHHIKEGDIFQIVLANGVEAEFSGDLLSVYKSLRDSNPSPYMFYFTSQNIELFGSSPETLVKLSNDKIYTFPLAGSRPRTQDERQNLALEKELLSDEKELSEHNMLVDLARNDVGMVSKVGSVKVEQYMDIVRFSHICHISSLVTGIRKKNKDALDILESILPAGTLSGAPKIKAIELISKLEDIRRGIYGGGIGYLALNGEMDTCISIRLGFAKHTTKGNKIIHIKSGAGIVLQSDPKSEYIETQNKAKALILALKSTNTKNK